MPKFKTNFHVKITKYADSKGVQHIVWNSLILTGVCVGTLEITHYLFEITRYLSRDYS